MNVFKQLKNYIKAVKLLDIAKIKLFHPISKDIFK